MTNDNPKAPPKDWFTADTHFGHENIIRYAGRPFKTAAENDAAIIANWNSRVAPRDRVFFLGDFAFRNKEAALAIRRKLNGNIFFISGNHDAAARQIKDTFGWYEKSMEVESEGHKFYLSHYAHRVWNKSHHGVMHLYGHSHGSLPDDPRALSMDVGVDSWARICKQDLHLDALRPEDYRPISTAEVLEWMGRKTWQPIDHHGGDRERFLIRYNDIEEETAKTLVEAEQKIALACSGATGEDLDVSVVELDSNGDVIAKYDIETTVRLRRR